MKNLKILYAFISDEFTLKSSYGKELGNDTLQRWLFTVLVSCFFFYCVYQFDEYAVLFDHWGHEVFGWRLSDIPSAGKISWHRTLAAGLSGIAILAATVEYVIWLRRRWKARRVAS